MVLSMAERGHLRTTDSATSSSLCASGVLPFPPAKAERFLFWQRSGTPVNLATLLQTRRSVNRKDEERERYGILAPPVVAAASIDSIKGGGWVGKRTCLSPDTTFLYTNTDTHLLVSLNYFPPSTRQVHFFFLHRFSRVGTSTMRTPASMIVLDATA
jgi:hypothetical protein